MTSYVVHERANLEITISTGAPQALNLEIVLSNETSTVISLTDSEFTITGNTYRYSFPVTDAYTPGFKYRWWGLDVGGVEFAAPEDTAWITRIVKG